MRALEFAPEQLAQVRIAEFGTYPGTRFRPRAQTRNARLPLRDRSGHLNGQRRSCRVRLEATVTPGSAPHLVVNQRVIYVQHCNGHASSDG